MGMSGLLAGKNPLTADKKKLGMMAGLFGVLLVVIVIRFVLPGGASLDSASAQGAYGHGRRSLLDSQPAYLETIARMARLQSEKSYDAHGVRDPMQPLVRERTAPVAEPRATDESFETSDELPRMSLHGVIWDPENPIAIIDGLDLRVGDTIKGARVVEIGFDQVVLTYKSRRHVLTVD